MPSEMRIGVLASGRGSNLQSLLDAQQSEEYGARVAVVLCDRGEAGALERAREHGVPAVHVDPNSKRARLRPETEQQFTKALKNHDVDWVVLAGFMRLLGSEFLGEFGGRTINIHPSLLPSFPGLYPQRQALEAGVRVSGCTVHLVDSGMDTGPVLAQCAVPVHGKDTEDDLSARILREEHRLLPATVHRIATVGFDLSGRRVCWKDEV